MNKLVLAIIFTTLLFQGCVSVKRYNKNLSVLRTEKQLKYDVDFTYRKLQKLHPNLYGYISKKELDYKFDSLKATITGPMTSNEFYFKLSPVVASVKQGHARLFQLNKKLKFKEKIDVLSNGPTPFSQFDFETFDNKLYVVKNISGDTAIKAGTEIITANNVTPLDIISKYSNTFSSDGFNQTFINRRLSKGFPWYFYYQNGVADSVLCQVNYSDTVKTVWLKRNKNTPLVRKNKPAPKTSADIARIRMEQKKKRELGYDPLTKTYSKNLTFMEPDSSIAVMKLNDFYKGNYKKFLSAGFAKMDSLKTKTLILDLRDNPGGKIKEAAELYSYLTDSAFCFIDKSEVTSRFSLMRTADFRSMPLLAKTFYVAFSPLHLVSAGILCFKIQKNNGKYYYTFRDNKLRHPKPNTFKGKVYVIINGGSFSASCLLSSNLKGSGRAIFVGEETGGDFNGTVAGVIPRFTLPKSKLPIAFGMALVQPYHKTNIEGRGIFPDIPVTPTLQDRVAGTDPEIDRILDHMKQIH